MICESYTLNELDNSLGPTYESLLENCHTGVDIKQDQRHWLKDVRDACQTSQCLETAYRSRIAELNAIKENKDTVCGICLLSFGKKEKVSLRVTPSKAGCALGLYGKGDRLVQEIELDSSCPRQCNTFDPNQDGYEDFVIDVGYMMGPFMDTDAWIYSKKSSGYVRDTTFPGGSPSSPKCTNLQYRTGVGGGKYVYASEIYCYQKGRWVLEGASSLRSDAEKNEFGGSGH